MDNISNYESSVNLTSQTPDENLSLPEESQDDNLLDAAQKIAECKKPYYEWTIGDKIYKLKLTTTAICLLEDKFGGINLLEFISQGLPTLKKMLMIIQAAMLKYYPDIKSKEVYDTYEEYIDTGSTITDLYSNVIMGVMSVSGFFTKEQENELKKTIQ